MHNLLPKWIDCDLPSEYDIALLRPATLPKPSAITARSILVVRSVIRLLPPKKVGLP